MIRTNEEIVELKHEIEASTYLAAYKNRLRDLFDTIADLQRQLAEQRVDEALEQIRQIASGEKQVADDDTAGMAYIDKLCQQRLAAARSRVQGKPVTPPEPAEPLCVTCRQPESYHRKLIHDFLPAQPAKEGSNR